MAYITFQPSDHFNSLTYTGNGASPRSITGVGFRPDLVWTKDRSDSSTQPWHDVVRGATYALRSDSNVASQNTPAYGYINSFDSDGYTFQQGSSDIGRFNDNSNLYVSFNWKAGNAQGSSNTDGSINTTYTSVNTTAGFSISQYTGNGIADATVGHGLGAKVDFLIIKDLGNASNWIVGHKDTFTTGEIYLNQGNSLSAAFGPFNKTAPTTSVFNLGTDVICNGSGRNYIAYAYATKKGFSRFGSYTGNGSTDGPFVYTGFKPAFVMAKKTSGTGDWGIWDNKRDGFNETVKRVYANDSAAEESSATQGIDFLCNGFKLRGTSSNAWNSGNDTYIYMSFAGEPLVSSNEIPATAR
jgi:hypothetical protein